MNKMFKIENDEFINRLKETPVGLQVIAARDGEHRGRRHKAAARVLEIETHTAVTLESVDREISKKKDIIVDLAEKLRLAQSQHGRLVKHRFNVESAKSNAVRGELAYLQYTAPVEVRTLIDFANRVCLSAELHLRPRFGGDPKKAPESKAQQAAKAKALRELFERASTVHVAARALALKPDASVKDVVLLRAELSAPASYDAMWLELFERHGERAKTNILTGDQE